MKNTGLKVITFGVFDMFHFGHLCLFENIKKKFGENCFLIVCVQDSEKILKYKPDSKIFYTTEERVRMIKNLKCVDDIDVDIKQASFDVWVKGPDQSHQGFINATEWCNENGKQVVTMPRTEGISSSYLKKLISDFS